MYICFLSLSHVLHKTRAPHPPSPLAFTLSSIIQKLRRMQEATLSCTAVLLAPAPALPRERTTIAWKLIFQGRSIRESLAPGGEQERSGFCRRESAR